MLCNNSPSLGCLLAVTIVPVVKDIPEVFPSFVIVTFTLSPSEPPLLVIVKVPGTLPTSSPLRLKPIVPPTLVLTTSILLMLLL